MSSRQNKGRPAPAVRVSDSSNRTFYIILAVVSILGVAALVTIILGSRNSSSTTTTANPAAAAPTVNPATLPTLSINDFVFKGKADAPVTVVEYSDFQCPACAFYATNLAKEIDQLYVDTGKIKFVYHEFPLPQHGNAVKAAEAGRCANEQNAFWKMHDILFLRQSEWAASGAPAKIFGEYAAGLGLDKAAFDQCLSSGKYQATVLAAQKRGNDANVNSTPTFEVNGQRYTATDLKAAIEAAVAGR